MADPLEPPVDDAPPLGELTRPPGGGGGGGARIPPHNLQAEESLLGAMMLSRDAIAVAVQTVSAGDFYKPAHAHVFDAVSALYAAGEPVDGVTVAEQLRRADLFDAIGGAATLAHLQASTPATTNAGHYARIVEEHSLMRKLIGVAGEIAEIGYGQPDDVEKAVDTAETMVFDVAERRVTDTLAGIHDLMEGSLDRLEALYERGDAITGVATGFHDLDDVLSGLQEGSLIVVGARPSMGKCVAWDTPIVDPQTGAVITAAEMHRRGSEGEPVEVLSLDEAAQRIGRRVPSAFVDDGVKPVFEVRTRLGRRVRTTATHPFLTGAGWRPLAHLQVGDRVAVPRELPFFGSEQMADAEVVVLAYLIGDGAVTAGSPKFTNACPEVIDEMRMSTESLGAELRFEAPAGAATTFRIATDRGQPNPVLDLVRHHGLYGCNGHTKRVPDAVFRLPRQQVALFLSRLFATNGSAWWSDSGGGYGRISYCTVSAGLARDIQHLLLRFGLNARVREKRVEYRDQRRPAFELELMGRSEIETFAAEIGIFGKEDRVAHLVDKVGAKGRLGPTRDPLPVDVWDQVLEAKGAEPWAEVSERTGRPRNHNWHVHRRSPRRETVAQLGSALSDPGLQALASSDIYWDEVVAVEFAGHEQVYDLTVPGDHNFVAGDVFVHNTALGLGMTANAALEAQRPVLLFSLEMSHLELTQRLLCSEARVDSKRIRTGNLAEADWSKISHAVGRLGDAPIWIDDNPNTTVMEIRAKARRLKAKIGDLGLIVVDYLQLMTGRDGAESRQVEVSEISRGLKILARELETPVVALSQLSRGLEQRTDKRPMLADLRESGCLTADSRIVRADTGAEVTIGELLEAGERDVPVWTLDERYRLVRGTMSHVFPSGTKRVYELRLASGRALRASGNHPFLRLGGWTPLDDLAVGDRIAVARREPSPAGQEPMSDDEVVLLAHLLGDGCTLAGHALQYTTVDLANAEAVSRAAAGFGVTARLVRDEPAGRAGWYQLFLPSPHRLTHGRRNPIASWLDELGVWDKRSYEKYVPPRVFGQTDGVTALFLRHLWATDGTVSVTDDDRARVAIAYATTSRRLADDVVRLLARLDIQGRVSRLSQGPNRPIHQVVVSGADNQRRFIELVGGQGERARSCEAAKDALEDVISNPNVDSIPAEVWGLVRKAMGEYGVTTRELAAGLGMRYCGSALYKSGVSRDRLGRVADLVPDRTLRDLAGSDVLWDRIVAIEDCGEEPVYDATVDGTHNFVANGVVVHNSIEQDADVVLFIYRDEVYDPESPHRGTAEIIVSKHRNGPTGVARLAFLDHFTRFENMAKGV